MKKIIYIIAFTLLLVTSCSLDRHPRGSVDSSVAIQSVQDAQFMRNYLYIRLRSLVSGGAINSPDIASDLFHASQGFGNRGGISYMWTWEPSNGYAAMWSESYELISNAYFVIEGINALDKSTLSDADKKQLNLFLGEANFSIAYAYSFLVEKFCNVYNSASASTAMGVCLIDKYDPTSNSSKYPPRASLAETYDRIAKHIKEATTFLADVNGVKDSEYITKDVITAFEARIALVKGDWDTAIAKSTSLISAGNYPLISDATAYKNMWINDNGKESIMQLYALKDPASLPDANGSYYVGYNSTQKTYSPDYIPTKGVIDLYDKTNDIRFNAYFEKQKLTYATSSISNVEAYICTKFPGNPELYSGSSNYVNKVKLFRIAEQYLIAAEAYANKGGNDAAAATILNSLKVKRIAGFDQSILLSGDALKTEIKNERVRELFAEGFRFFDIKRYKTGFTRPAAQNPKLIFLSGDSSTEFLSKKADDYRFVYPIPQSEMDANPQLKGQQNPGY